jgi:uncharacterized membrane protein YgdD (TMEM256/DUF423 family)
MSTAIIRFSGILGAMGVGAGAYGAHALEASWQERGMDLDDDSIKRWLKVWNTGWVMNMAGSAATLGVGGSSLIRRPGPLGALIGGGTLLFSASTYAAAYYTERKYSMGAPIGGSATILGWIVLVLAP